MRRSTRDRITGTLAILLIVGTMTAAGALLGKLGKAEGREIVCMPSVETPTPSDEIRKTPARYNF